MNNRQKAKRFKLLYEVCSQKTLEYVPLIIPDRLPSVHLATQMNFGRDEPNMEFARSALIRGLMPEVMKYAMVRTDRDDSGNIVAMADVYVLGMSEKARC